MRELPLHMKLDHLREIRRGNGFVQSRPAFRFVEGISDRIPRKFYAESLIERQEAIQPMQAVAIEGSAHVEKNRANHWQDLVDHKPAGNLWSALRCHNQKVI